MSAYGADFLPRAAKVRDRNLRSPRIDIQDHGRWGADSSDGDASRSASNAAAGIGRAIRDSLNLLAAALSQQGELALRFDSLCRHREFASPMLIAGKMMWAEIVNANCSRASTRASLVWSISPLQPQNHVQLA